MAHTRPSMGRMASRHSWHTGSREILTRGSPQIRQSEGNKTAKRLSAMRLVQTWRKTARPEAIEGPATAALAWLARILSPLLLKTASVLPAGILILGGRLARLPTHKSITAAAPARQRYGRVVGPKSPPSSPLRAAALSLARTAGDSPAESTLHSAPAAAEKSAEDSARQTTAGASGSPYRCRNRRSEIQGISGTRLDRGSFLPRFTSESGDYEGAPSRIAVFYA
jgi:hypothetical protein